MDRKQQVMSRLKPKVKAFGFNKKEMMSVAAKIADNLTSADDASDEDVNAEIETAIDAVLPYLQVSQSFANRVIEENRKKNDDDDETDDDDDDKPSNPKNRQPGSNKKNTQSKGKEQDDEPSWFKSFREQQEARFAALEGEKIANSRKSKLESLLKDTGTFGSRTLKSFQKMKFENDDEFDEFYSEVEEDLKAYNQERANEGLSALGVPPGTEKSKHEREENEVLSDEDIKELAAL